MQFSKKPSSLSVTYGYKIQVAVQWEIYKYGTYTLVALLGTPSASLRFDGIKTNRYWRIETLSIRYRTYTTR